MVIKLAKLLVTLPCNFAVIFVLLKKSVVIKNIFLLLFCCLFNSSTLWAQTEAFSGTWQMEYAPNLGSTPIKFELNIAPSQRNILYPANIKIECDSFVAEYELLLVKKNSRELGISKKKYARFEKPFSLHDWSLLLSGTFDLRKDLKGTPVLNILRMQTKQAPVAKPAIADTLQPTAIRLRNFLKGADISLKKINSIPWHDDQSDRILEPALSPTYFGLRDTIYLPTRDGIINFSASKKRKNDIVSVTLNGQVIFDKIETEKKKYESDILLTPGVNILTFFVDNFGGDLPSTSRLNLEFGNKKFALDFANRKDSGATFITVKLVCDPDKSRERYFVENTKPGEEKLLLKDEKLAGSIISDTQHLTFAIWDDVIDDGDSISIKINNEWLVQGCPVKKAPKYITVTLKPGANTIIFMADNLGSIPPNTSVLEIIDGKRRKSYEMDSKPGEKNIVKILYDTGGPL